MISQTHLYIKGDVIGVGFRAWTKIQAKIFSVKGWVKNVYNREDIFGPGGGVEALLQGEKESIAQMVEAIKKGPPIARVDEVEAFEQDSIELFEEFKIRA